ncbi:hypothetical protein OROMI_003456 [Orobanche minor]
MESCGNGLPIQFGDISNGHWVVVVIDMVTPKIYHIDPVPDGHPDEELKQMVNDAVQMHQPSTFECGYYVMKYLQDVVHDPHVFEHNFSECHDFNMDNLSRLGDEWAAYVAKLIVAHNNQASRLKEKAIVGQKHG